MKKCFLIFLIILLITLIGMKVSANIIVDASNDVYHHSFSDNNWSWILTSGKTHIDISKISYSVSGGILTVIMELNGDIEIPGKASYTLYYNSTEASYTFIFVNRTGSASAMKIEGGFDFKIGEFTAEDNVLTVKVELFGAGIMDKFWGYSAEYLVDFSTIEDPNVLEYWGGWTPQFYSPWYTGIDEETDDETNGNGIEKKDEGKPDFEFCILLIVIGIYILYQKRKRNI